MYTKQNFLQRLFCCVFEISSSNIKRFLLRQCTKCLLQFLFTFPILLFVVATYTITIYIYIVVTPWPIVTLSHHIIRYIQGKEKYIQKSFFIWNDKLSSSNHFKSQNPTIHCLISSAPHKSTSTSIWFANSCPTTWFPSAWFFLLWKWKIERKWNNTKTTQYANQLLSHESNFSRCNSLIAKLSENISLIAHLSYCKNYQRTSDRKMTTKE